MGIEILLGVIIAGGLLGTGQIIRKKQSLFFLAGFGDSWAPVNKKRLGNRVGILFMVLGLAAFITPIAMIWLGSVAIKATAILAIVAVIMMIIAIGLDQMGY